MKTIKELKEGEYGYKYRIGYEHCKEDILKLIDELSYNVNDDDWIDVDELKKRIEG